MAEVNEVMEEEAFHIDSDQKAEWGIRKIKEAEAERDRQIEVCREQILFYQNVIEQESKRFENSTSYLKNELVNYFYTVPHKETKTQETYKLPSGTLKLTKAKLDMEHDDTALLSFLKANAPEMVQVTEKPMWGEYKKKLTIVGNTVVDTETGMEVDGVTVVEKPGSFDVK